MNRQFSYNWLKEYLPSLKLWPAGVKASISAEEFAREFSLKSMSIDRVVSQKPVFKKVVIGKIIEIKPHPNADRLRLVTVDYKSGQQTVVCGAPNIQVGDVIAFALAGASLLNPDNLAQTVTLKKATIRGVESSGMVCGLDELGFGTEHYNVLALPRTTALGQ